METARNARTGATLSVDIYGRLTEAQRATIDLVCDGVLPAGTPCAAIAHFRRRSVDGRRACFFSTAHGEGCSQSSFASDDGDGDAGRATQVRTASASLITIRLDPPRPSTGPDGRSRPDEDQPGETTSRHVVRPGRVETGFGATSRRPKTILANLLADQIAPEVPIALGDGDPILAKRLFVPMSITSPTAPAASKELFRGYWGIVRRAVTHSRTGSLMLYAEDVSDPPLKVVVTPHQAEKLDLREDRYPQLVGMAMLALGTYKIGNGGKPYIALPSPWNLALLRRPAKPTT